jgi:hypothetical protein
MTEKSEDYLDKTFDEVSWEGETSDKEQGHPEGGEEISEKERKANLEEFSNAAEVMDDDFKKG